MASHAGLRNIFARETISQKSHILQSEKDATERMAAGLAIKADGEDVFQSLQRHINAINSAPLAHGHSLKTAAKEAQIFLDLTGGSLGGCTERSPHADVARSWLNRLTAEVEHLRRRAEHASLFGQVLQEWIDTDGGASSEGDSLGGAKRSTAHADGDEGSMINVLAPEPLSPFDVEAYLGSHDVSTKVLKAMKASAAKTAEFGTRILKDTIGPSEVCDAMRALAGDAKAYGPDLRRQLLDESGKSIVLEELSEIFTSQWRTIETWAWPAEGVLQLEQTHLNGKRRGVLSLDVVPALFLRIVASRWIAHFRDTAFVGIKEAMSAGGAVTEISSIDDEDETSYRDIAGMIRLLELTKEGSDLEEGFNEDSDNALGTVVDQIFHVIESDTKRRTAKGWEAGRGSLASTIGASGLFAERRHDGDPNSQDDLDEYGGIFTPSRKRGRDKEAPTAAEKAKQVDERNYWAAGVAAQRPAINPSEIYRLVTMDIHLFRATCEDRGSPTTTAGTSSVATFLHADLRDFGASVPHSVTLGVLRFFGLPQRWLDWFENYLRIPLVLEQGGAPSISGRGTPFGLMVTSLVNELLLSILDLAVNATARVNIRRNHDDIWIWSLGRDRVEKAWEVAQDFARQTGLSWNMEKTGCTIVTLQGGQDTVPPSGPSTKIGTTLPSRRFAWGVLTLAENGQWEVDKDAVLSHAQAAVRELRLQQGASSFLGKINVYNRYAAFLARNAGVPMAFATDSFPETYDSILRIFEDHVTGGRGVIAWLQNQLSSGPGVGSTSTAGSVHPQVQAGVLVWPLRLGGFELHPHAAAVLSHKRKRQNLIDECAGRDNKGGDFADLIDQFAEQYALLREFYESSAVEEQISRVEEVNSHGPATEWLSRWLHQHGYHRPPFMSLRTFLRHSVGTSDVWRRRYENLVRDTPLDAEDIKELMTGAYLGPLTEHFGSLHEGQALVATSLVSQYAVQDLQALAKQLYNS